MKTKNTATGWGQTHPKESHSDIFKAGESDITVIKFEGVKVRVVNIHWEPWFIAVDVCKALETDNPTKTVKALVPDGNTLTSIQGIYSNVGAHHA